MTIESAAVRVARGVALLDEKRPGWWEKVDVARLNMRHPCGCVLGQLDGEYCDAVHRLAGIPVVGVDAILERNKFGAYYGFDILNGVLYLDDFCAKTSAYDELRRLWLDVIAARKAEAPVVTWTHRERETVR